MLYADLRFLMLKSGILGHRETLLGTLHFLPTVRRPWATFPGEALTAHFGEVVQYCTFFSEAFFFGILCLSNT